MPTDYNPPTTAREQSVTRARRFRRVASVLVVLFLITGVLRLTAATVPLIDPRLGNITYECNPCVLQTDPVLLLEPESARQKARRTPGSEQRILERIRLPEVKLMLFIASAVRAIPFFVMFLGFAMALRSFARAGFNRGGVRWLRRSALAAIVWTVAQPVAMSIRQTAFSPITHGRELRHLVFDSSALILGILIAGAAWLTVWALEEAVTMQRELEEYV